ncbi:plasma membrane calcium, partial [Basidiobolus ranarum]
MVESTNKDGVEIEIGRLRDSSFSLTPAQIMEWVDNKDLDALVNHNGIDGILSGLQTDIATGLNTEDTFIGETENNDSPDKAKCGLLAQSLDQRRQVFGTNILPEAKAKNILQLIWMAYQDKMLILLTIAALVSLALGIYED